MDFMEFWRIHFLKKIVNPQTCMQWGFPVFLYLFPSKFLLSSPKIWCCRLVHSNGKELQQEGENGRNNAHIILYVLLLVLFFPNYFLIQYNLFCDISAHHWLFFCKKQNIDITTVIWFGTLVFFSHPYVCLYSFIDFWIISCFCTRIFLLIWWKRHVYIYSFIY